MDQLISDIYNIIECMASKYDLETTSLKEFLRDVKQCHALHEFLCNKLEEPYKINI